MFLKMEGISFIIRARNEEKNIEACIRSLDVIQVPHEIIVILHLCTDRTKDIVILLAKKNKKIKYYEYNALISRAGYETLATDMDSEHSMIHYCNWCYKKASYLWRCKWDADFRMTPSFAKFINTENIWKENCMRLRLVAKNSTSEEWNDYLCSSINRFYKYLFWEVPMHNELKRRDLDRSIYIEHFSELSEIKSYWNELPWYETDTSDEARIVKERIANLTAEFGKEPTGMARSMNPVCDVIMKKIEAKKPSYVNIWK